MEKPLEQLAEGSYSLIFAAFLRESIVHIIPWMAAAACVILCDLIVGIRASMILGDDIRFSSACRRTLGKMVSYFTFVVMVSVVDVAANGGGKIDKYACLLVCFIEGCSIINNILRPKGITLDVKKLLCMVTKKKFGVEVDDIIKEEGDGGKKSNLVRPVNEDGHTNGIKPCDQ